VSLVNIIFLVSGKAVYFTLANAGIFNGYEYQLFVNGYQV